MFPVWFLVAASQRNNVMRGYATNALEVRWLACRPAYCLPYYIATSTLLFLPSMGTVIPCYPVHAKWSTFPSPPTCELKFISFHTQYIKPVVNPLQESLGTNHYEFLTLTPVNELLRIPCDSQCVPTVTIASFQIILIAYTTQYAPLYLPYLPSQCIRTLTPYALVSIPLV